MLSKKNRADTKIVEKVFKTGKFVNSRFLTFKYIQNKANLGPRISFLAPKSVAKGAVERNSLRRRGYRVLKSYINEFPKGVEGVLVYKKALITPIEVENEIKDILSKVN
ncbi:MAG: ribonuclease P protein component [Candidatus Pacebacteria bacterium]|nr:ribonuclease P protein component [Candidatus Paceibacterota bacterium]